MKTARIAFFLLLAGTLLIMLAGCGTDTKDVSRAAVEASQEEPGAAPNPNSSSDDLPSHEPTESVLPFTEQMLDVTILDLEFNDNYFQTEITNFSDQELAVMLVSYVDVSTCDDFHPFSASEIFTLAPYEGQDSGYAPDVVLYDYEAPNDQGFVLLVRNLQTNEVFAHWVISPLTVQKSCPRPYLTEDEFEWIDLWLAPGTITLDQPVGPQELCYDCHTFVYPTDAA